MVMDTTVRGDMCFVLVVNSSVSLSRTVNSRV